MEEKVYQVSPFNGKGVVVEVVVDVTTEVDVVVLVDVVVVE